MAEKIVAVSGTSRPDNFTFAALGVVVERMRARDREVTVFDPREMTLAFPGYPATADAERLRDAVFAADAVVIATPEYHGTFSAMTKLMIENMGFPSALQGKPVGLLGVAAGRLGAVKSLEQLRGVCAHTGAIVLPRAISIAGVRAMFDEQGKCTDPQTEQLLHGLADSVVDFIDDYVRPRVVLEAIARGEVTPWAAEV